MIRAHEFTIQPATHTREINTGEKITQPGMSVSPAEALRRYSAGTITTQIEGYYDSLVGLDPDNWPKDIQIDIMKLDKVEKMVYLNQIKKSIKSLKTEANAQAAAIEEKINTPDPPKEPEGEPAPSE